MDGTYSYVNMILLLIIGGMFTAFTAFAGWWASNVNKQLLALNNSDNEMSEKLTKLDTWSESHNKQDDGRQIETEKRLDRNHSSVHSLRDQIAELAIKFNIYTRRMRDDEHGQRERG